MDDSNSDQFPATNDISTSHGASDAKTPSGPMESISLLSEDVSLIDCVYIAVDVMIIILNTYLEGITVDSAPSIRTIKARTTPARHTNGVIEAMLCMRGEDPTCFAFLERHLRVCKAVVIDVDAVVYGGLIRGCSAYHHDPTVLKFMSRRGLSARDVSGLTHSVLDDVEGVLWMVIWKIVTHADRERREMVWHKALSSDRVKTVNHTKHAIVAWFSERDHVSKRKNKVGVVARPLIFWDAIYDIMKEWMAIAKEARKDLEAFESDDEEIRALTLEYSAMYLKAGVEFLEKSGQYRDGTE